MINKTNRLNSKRQVAMFSLVVTILLVIVKVLIAYLSNSIGVLSEALNNGLDLVTVLIVFLAIRMSTKPPDADHTYGHGKYENLSALFEIIVISLLCFFVIYKSIQRIILRDFELRLNNYVFIVLAISIIVNIIRVYFVGRAAKKFDSYAFKAEFLNYFSDIVSSLIVLIGLFFARAGFYLADPIASIIISIMILIFGARMAVTVIKNFLDYIPGEVTEKVRTIVNRIPEISSVDRILIHEVGNIKFINLRISVDDNIYLSRLENLKGKIADEITKDFPGSEIMVSARSSFSEENIDCKVKEILLDQEDIKDIHNIFIYNVDDKIDISVHVELKKSLSLAESEKLTALTEGLISEKINDIRNIYIHIEDEKSGENWNDITPRSEDMIKRIRAEISNYILPESCHNFTILERNGNYNIAFHCRLDKDMEVDSAHSIITKIENRIKHISASIGEVLVHVEPG
ncbi:MAG: cation-efflux pump [Actinobacteria bacterium]|nr:cation-efflux pump [Actinomycetota bacterium]MBU4450680.1 cation-efflux pump [Actinomycetota bacterium]MCG2791165.1 cation-efflux pump [Actinomycetes bacterium]